MKFQKKADRLRREFGMRLKVHKADRHHNTLCGTKGAVILSTEWKHVECKSCLKYRKFRMTKNAFIPTYIDPAIIELTKSKTPLTELIPRVKNAGATANFNDPAKPRLRPKESLFHKLKRILRQKIRIDWSDNWCDWEDD